MTSTPLSSDRPRRRTTLAALDLVARLRYATVPLLVAHLGVSPDAAYRLLRRLARADMVRTFRYGLSPHQGPPGIVCILTWRGASALVEADLEDAPALRALCRSSAARARDVEAGLVTTLAHDLDVLMLHALLTISTRASADASLWWPSWTSLLDAPLITPPSAFSASELIRLCGERSPGASVQLAYAPDALVRVDRGGATTVLLLEVETGKGGRSPDAIGAVKAAKMRAVWSLVRHTGELPGTGPIAPDALRFATWCPSARFRDRFLDGARRVLGGEPLPLIATSAEELPLRLPPALPKTSVAPLLERMAEPLAEAVWKDLRGASARLLEAPSPAPAEADPEPVARPEPESLFAALPMMPT